MSIVFLDIDGVVCHAKYQPTLKKGGIFEDIDPRCVGEIVNLLVENDAEIVVHSTWVHTDPHDYVRRCLEEAGLPPERFHKDWVCNQDIQKKISISKWLEAHPEVKNYVVIDDDPIDGHPQILVKNGLYAGGFSKRVDARDFKGWNKQK